MKTSDFIAAVRLFGWEVERTTKHIHFKNVLFAALRPVPLSFNCNSQIDPENVENTAKAMGLRWKDMDSEPFPRVNSSYFTEYARLGLVKD